MFADMKVSGILKNGVLVAMLTAAGMASCGRNAVTHTLDRACELMNDSAVAAYSLLQSVDASDLHRSRDIARYALLFTQAQYKSYVDETDDSLINIAVDYYSDSRDTDSRFLSYYCQGCIYMNGRDYARAALSLSMAEQLVPFISDDYRTGLLYSKMGELYAAATDYVKAGDYYRKASDSYKKAERYLPAYRSLRDVALALYAQEDYRQCMTVLAEVYRWAVSNDRKDLQKEYAIYYFATTLMLGQMGNVEFQLEAFRMSSGGIPDNPFLLSKIAEFYYMKNQPDSVILYIDKAWKAGPTASDSIQLYYLESLVNEQLGNSTEAFDNYRNTTVCQTRNLRQFLSQPIAGIQNDYLKTVGELESLKARRRADLLFFTIFISAIIICAGCILYRYRRKAAADAINEKIAEIQQLSQNVRESELQINSLSAQISQLFCRQYASLEKMCVAYYETPGDRHAAQRLYDRIQKEIHSLTDNDNIKEMDALINKAHNGIMEQLHSAGLNEMDTNILRLSIVGYSIKSVSVILGENSVNIYQRRRRAMMRLEKQNPELYNTLVTICK